MAIRVALYRATLLAAFVVLAGCATTSPTGPSAERPTYKVGERWFRSDGAFELTRIENGRFVFSAGPSREIHLTQNLGIGLRGKGDLNRDGIVSLQELYEYLEQQVTQKSRAVGGNQHPVMKGELEGVLPLVRVRRR